MSKKFLTWIRVTPVPSTLTESSSILKQLKKHGNVEVFTRVHSAKSTADKELYATYYIEFKHRPSGLEPHFDVPVYHDKLSAADEDPFNIRGIKHRKPWPKSVRFQCTIETSPEEEEMRQTIRAIEDGPYHSHFRLDSSNLPRELRDFYTVLGTTPGLNRAFNHFPRGEDTPYPPVESKHNFGDGFEMNALMASWERARTETELEQKNTGQETDDFAPFSGD